MCEKKISRNETYDNEQEMNVIAAGIPLLQTRFSVHAACCEGRFATWTKPCGTSGSQCCGPQVHSLVVPQGVRRDGAARRRVVTAAFVLTAKAL